MHAMVSARVPVEIKRQGDRKLKDIGSNATELINAAYAYVIEHGAIPGAAEPKQTGNPVTKTLDREDAAAFRQRWSQRQTLDASRYDGSNFRELLDEARKDRHARFA